MMRKIHFKSVITLKVGFKRECIAIKKGDNGWNAIAVLPTEYRDMDLKVLEKDMCIQDGRDFYDFRIDPETFLIWLKKKDININIVTKR